MYIHTCGLVGVLANMTIKCVFAYFGGAHMCMQIWIIKA